MILFVAVGPSVHSRAKGFSFVAFFEALKGKIGYPSRAEVPISN